MVRTQIQLTEAQARSLKELASQRGISVAELIRQAVERTLDEADQRPRRERALALIGRFRTEPVDLAVGHDRYLAEGYAR